MQLIKEERIIGHKPFKIALFSDLHIDSLDCDREKLKSDLNWAYNNCDDILLNGDVFSCILPGDRKRFVRSQSMFDSDAQLNEIVKYVADYLTPYADKIRISGLGNHETSVMKWNSYNPMQGLVDILNYNGAKIKLAGYKDYIRYVFKATPSATSIAFDILKFHGAGGSAPVTKGMIDLARLGGVFLADLIWIGHKHTAIVNNSGVQLMISSQNKIVEKASIGIITPGYHKIAEQKDSFDLSYSEERFNGISAQNGFGILNLQIVNKKLRRDVRIMQ